MLQQYRRPRSGHHRQLLRLAGDDAPALDPVTFASTCPEVTVDLFALAVPTNAPASAPNVRVQFHTVAMPVDQTTNVADSSMVAGGTYYAVFYDPDNECYSPGTEITVTTDPCIELATSCECFDVPYDEPEFDPYEFLDSVVICSQPGETWTVQSQEGTEVVDSFVNAGPIAIGTVLEEIPGMPGKYGLRFASTRDSGYVITFVNNLGQDLTQTNTCTSSEITVPALRNGPFCPEGEAVTLIGESTLNGVPSAGTFSFELIDPVTGAATPITMFDPSPYNSGDIIEVRGRFEPVDQANDCPKTFSFFVDINDAACPCPLGQTMLIYNDANVAINGVNTYDYTIANDCSQSVELDITVSGNAENLEVRNATDRDLPGEALLLVKFDESRLDRSGPGVGITVEYTFDSPLTLNSWTIYDIDGNETNQAGRYLDGVTLSASNADGDVPLILSPLDPDPVFSINGQSAEAIANGGNNRVRDDNPRGQLLVSSGGVGVTSIIATYYGPAGVPNINTSQQIYFGGFELCCPVPPADLDDINPSYGFPIHFRPTTAMGALQIGQDVDTEDLTAGTTFMDGDDGLVSTDPLRNGITEFSAVVQVINTSGAAAQLVGWVDFNENGNFDDPGERSLPIGGTFANPNVPDNSTDLNVTLTWSGFAPADVGSSTFSRFRLTSDPEFFTDMSPTPGGTVTTGEVESFELQVCDVELSLADASGCSGEELEAITATEPDGVYSIINMMGATAPFSTVDAMTGVVTLGDNPGTTAIVDTVVYTIDGNCTDSLLVTIDPNPDAPVSNGDEEVCFGDDNPTLSVQVVTGFSYSFSDETGTVVSLESTFTPTVTDVMTYTYQVTATNDASGCTSAPTAVSLTILPLPDAPVSDGDESICFGEENPELSVGAVAGAMVEWFDAPMDGTALESGTTYTPTVSAPGTYTFYAQATDDVSGCESARTAVQLTINASPVLVVTDSIGCSEEQLPPLAEESGQAGTFSVISSLTNPPTTVMANGAIMLGFNASNTPVVDTVIFVATATGCADTVPVTINPLPRIPMNGVVTTVGQDCESDMGTITITASGGTMDYEYSIDGGQTFQASNEFTGLMDGVYNVFVRNANTPTVGDDPDDACPVAFVNNPVSILTPPAPRIDGISVSQPEACPNPDNDDDEGAISITATLNPTQPGYDPNDVPLLFSIDGGVTFEPGIQPMQTGTGTWFFNADGLEIGTYDIVVSKNNGTCEVTSSPPVEIVAPERPFIINTASTSPSACNLMDGSIMVTAGGGEGMLMYTLNDGTPQTSGNFTGLGNGEYTVSVTNENGSCEELAFQMLIFTPCIPDTIRKVIPPSMVMEICASTDMIGTVTSVALCDNYRQPDGTILSLDNTTGCVDYQAVATPGTRDSFCLVVCDDMGTKDTTFVFIAVPPPNDTVPIVTPPDVQTPPVCLDIDDVIDDPGLIEYCAGGEGNGLVTSVINQQTGCVTVTSLENSGADTICVVVCDLDEPTLCDTTFIPIIITIPPDTIPDVVPPNTTGDPLCPMVDGSITSMGATEFCADAGSMGNGTVTFAIDANGCVVPTAGPDAGRDTACVVVCDTEVPTLCDTTIILITVPPMSDTIPVVTPPDVTSPPVCPMVDPVITNPGATEFCMGTDGTGANGLITSTIDANGCVVITSGPTPGLDTICVVVCDLDEPLVCDTTIIPIIITIPPDTIPDVVPPNTTGDPLCPMVDGSITSMGATEFCADAGSMGNGTVTFAIDANGCVVPTAGPDAGRDTACVVVCDTEVPTLCDTTIILITVPPAGDTLPIVTPPMTENPPVCPMVDPVITNPGAMEFCMGTDGTGANGLITSTIDANGCVVITSGPTPGLDTICVVVCDLDEPLVCDTTIIPIIIHHSTRYDPRRRSTKHHGRSTLPNGRWFDHLHGRHRVLRRRR